VRAPDLQPLEVMEVLRRTARDVGPRGPDDETGHGFLDVAEALRAVLSTADGQVLVPTPEQYGKRGSILIGPTTAAGLLPGLPEGAAVSYGAANGTIPVKPGSGRLDFTFTWTTSGQTSAPPPELKVRLVDPQGRALDVPVAGTRAEQSVREPAAGLWEWIAQAASPAAVGTISFEMTSTVIVSAPLDLTQDFGGTGGFFDRSPVGRLRTAWSDLDAAWGPAAPAALAAAVFAALGVAVVRLSRRP